MTPKGFGRKSATSEGTRLLRNSDCRAERRQECESDRMARKFERRMQQIESVEGYDSLVEDAEEKDPLLKKLQRTIERNSGRI